MGNLKFGFRFRQRLAARACTCAVALAALIAGNPAHAHLYCVTSVAELQTALAESSSGGIYNGEENDIYISAGTYKTGTATGNLPFTFTSSAASLLLISGAPANCASYSGVDASQVVLDGNNSSQVLNITSTQGPVFVGSLTIQNGEASKAGAGLAVNYDSSGNTLGTNNSVAVIGTIIRNNHTTAFCGGIATDAGGVTQLFFNVVAGNSADNGEEGGAAGCLLGNDDLLVENNTVTLNTTTMTGGIGGVSIAAIGAHFPTLRNNILWDNTNFGAYFFSPNANLDFNDYGVLGGVTPSFNTHALSTMPDFVNRPGGDFHLAGDSPLLGISPDLPNICCDVEHLGVPQTGRIDLGAYEETIFTANFDGF
ncbi:MAG: hypothetical protein WBV39_05240 [Rudaea sp.]